MSVIDWLGYDVVLGLHITAFLLNVTLVVVADAFGLAWVLGRVTVLPARLMHALHRVLWGGLVLSIITGYLLFATVAEYLLGTPAFLIKVGFVGALVVNSFIISRHLVVATTRPFVDTTRHERVRMVASGVVSTVSWIAVVLAATQLGL